MADYLHMLNERDGGIGGVKVVIEECETGYDTKKGVECCKSIKGKGLVLVNPPGEIQPGAGDEFDHGAWS